MYDLYTTTKLTSNKLSQGSLRLTYHQQSGRFNIPTRFRRRTQQALNQRLPRPSRNLSRVRTSLLLPPPCAPLTQLPLTPPPRIHAITTRLSPLPTITPASTRPQPPSGLEILETENFRLQCFQTLTGTKFLLFTEPQQANADAILRRVYELYADYVMKNPFYAVEMPVRCEGFDRRIGGAVRGVGQGGGGR